MKASCAVLAPLAIVTLIRCSPQLSPPAGPDLRDPGVLPPPTLVVSSLTPPPASVPPESQTPATPPPDSPPLTTPPPAPPPGQSPSETPASTSTSPVDPASAPVTPSLPGAPSSAPSAPPAPGSSPDITSPGSPALSSTDLSASSSGSPLSAPAPPSPGAPGSPALSSSDLSTLSSPGAPSSAPAPPSPGAPGSAPLSPGAPGSAAPSPGTSSSLPAPAPPSPGSPPATIPPPQSPALGTPSPQPPQQSDICAQNVSAAINHLQFELSRILRDESDIFLSPLTISVALAAIYVGTGGETTRQMVNALDYDRHSLGMSNVTSLFQSILSTLNTDTSSYKLLLSNNIFLRERYVVTSDYKYKVGWFFNVTVEIADDSVVGRDKVNRLVASQTDQRISKPIREGQNLEDAQMLVVSAAYFKGLWETPFAKALTAEDDFYKLDGTSKRVIMMAHKSSYLYYLEDPYTKYNYLQIPYAGRNVLLLIALPISRSEPPDLEMTSELLCRLISTMELRTLKEVKLPKFKLSYHIELKGPLRKMGITEIFEEGKADLGLISKVPGLHLDSVLHEAVLEVGDEGVEVPGAPSGAAAAAATAPEFIVNHPFQLYVVDKRKGIIVFSGKVTDPSL